MRDAFEFSNAQALSTLDSTGVVSTSVWDLEYSNSSVLNQTDMQVVGWLNVKILSTTNTGGDSGMYIHFRSDDTAALSHAHSTADETTLGSLFIKKSELVAGATFSLGVCKANLGRYLGLWYEVVSESLTGATAVDAWFSEQPQTELRIQKKPS